MPPEDSGTPARTPVSRDDAAGNADGNESPASRLAAAPRTKSAKGNDEMRELIRGNDQRLYDFCCYMLGPDSVSDDLVLSIFREFGEQYRRHAGRSRSGKWDLREARSTLYQLAWEGIRDALLRLQPSWVVGRDTRQTKSLDEDLVVAFRAKKSDPAAFRAQVVERLSRIDPDFRAPLVLRDVLGFEDEEAVRILGLRWGVFRHRLHRGRLECRDALRGRAMPQGRKEG